jgi:alpha-methylacyl-CoA racemase
MSVRQSRQGALAHLTIIEFAALGPAPFAGMMLADHGARVIRIDRPIKPRAANAPPVQAKYFSSQTPGMASLTERKNDVLSRGRESITLDLKNAAHRNIALQLIDRADALIEGYRPGVMESLGLGPEICLKRNPRLVYTRATGWGQTGPLAQVAGHDINFTALSGALHSSTQAGAPPTATPGLIGDFGGGGMFAAFGLLAALSHAQVTGRGQVVDAAASEGSAVLASLIYGWRSVGQWNDEAGTNNGDGGAHFYNTYQCADGKYISIGAMEAPFYDLLKEKCGLDDPLFKMQWDTAQWPILKKRLEVVFAKKTRAQWCSILEGSDVCFAPVLDLSEAPLHPHHVARKSFESVEGVIQPAPTPKMSITPAAPLGSMGELGGETMAILAELGIDQLPS